MTFTSVQHIWNPETGILPLPETWESLHVADFDAVRAEWQILRGRIGEGPQLQEALNQLYREWAIETGAIENLYDIERGVTESLIVKGISTDLMEHGSVDRDPEYIKNLIDDQRAALDGLFDFIKSDRPLSTSYIKELHSVMTRSQEEVEARTLGGELVPVPLLRGAWKLHPNYPVRDGISYHYCPPEQVDSEMERLVGMYSEYEKAAIPGDVLAAWLHHRFTQIHPFQDGNGRIARALATLVLVKKGVEALVITREERASYIQALEHADSGQLRPLCLTIARRTRAQFLKTRQRLDHLVALSSKVEHPAEKVRKILLAEINQEPAESRTRTWGFQTMDVLQATFNLKLIARLGLFDGDPVAYQVEWGGDVITPLDVWQDVKSLRLGEELDVLQSRRCQVRLGNRRFSLRIEQLLVNPEIERITVFQLTLFEGETQLSRWLGEVSGDTPAELDIDPEFSGLVSEIDYWFWEEIAKAHVASSSQSAG